MLRKPFCLITVIGLLLLGIPLISQSITYASPPKSSSKQLESVIRAPDTSLPQRISKNEELTEAEQPPDSKANTPITVNNYTTNVYVIEDSENTQIFTNESPPNTSSDSTKQSQEIEDEEETGDDLIINVSELLEKFYNALLDFFRALTVSITLRTDTVSEVLFKITNLKLTK